MIPNAKTDLTVEGGRTHSSSACLLALRQLNINNTTYFRHILEGMVITWWHFLWCFHNTFQKQNKGLFYSAESKIWILLSTHEWIKCIRKLFFYMDFDNYSNSVFKGSPKIIRFSSLYKCLQGPEWESTGNFLHQSLCSIISILKHRVIPYNSWFNGTGILVSS